MHETLLEMKNLQTYFFTDKGVVKAIDGVSFQIGQGETVCLVGESGCGKSLTAHSIMRLVPPPGKIVGGKVLLNGENLITKSENEMRRMRGNDISMIFQEPMTSLNPVYTVGDQIAEAFRLHQEMGKREAMEKAVEMLRVVGISLPERRAREYPHQMSGGMRQRVMIAMALSCNPKLLIADEPTTALDVTIQAQILELMRELKESMSTSILLITHDLGVVAEMADRVIVMYLGKVVEEGDVRSIFNKPLHPYTEGLLKSTPSMEAKIERLHQIEGMVPNLMSMPTGCRFHPRCPYAKDLCREQEPSTTQKGKNHNVACWYPLDAPAEEVAG